MGFKILPLAESPIIALQQLSYPLNIMLNYEDCLPWFYNEYIQLVWYKDMKGHLTFCNKDIYRSPNVSPWLEYQVFNKKFLISTISNLHDFIMNALNQNWYIISSFDEYYVPYRSQFQLQHFIHDFLLYGYNLDQREYLIYGFSGNVIKSTTIDFSQFEDAFMANIDTLDLGYKRFLLYKKRTDFNYCFDLNHFEAELGNYFHSKCPSEKYFSYERDQQRVYGLEIYEYLKEYVATFQEEQTLFDIRPLHILWEHKKCMNLRLKFLSHNSFIDIPDEAIDSYRKIEEISVMIRNLQLKYLISRRNEILNRICSGLEKAKILERETIEVILEHLYRCRPLDT